MSPWCPNLNLKFFRGWLLANENSSWLYGNPTSTSWNPTFQFGIQLFPELDSWNPTFKILVRTLYLQFKSFENTVGKGEIALNKQILLFPQCFYLFGELSGIFNKFEIVVCNLFQFGRVWILLSRKNLIHRYRQAQDHDKLAWLQILEQRYAYYKHFPFFSPKKEFQASISLQSWSYLLTLVADL